MLDEQTYQLKVDETLDELDEALGSAADKYGFEPDFQAGALTVEFEDPPAKFVVSPNSPVRQIWVSALTSSFKLDWAADQDAFVLKETGQTLKQLMADVIGKQLGVTVEL
jgi:CyaY protein